MQMFISSEDTDLPGLVLPDPPEPPGSHHPRPSAFCADALTTELRCWDDSTRRYFVTQLVLALSDGWIYFMLDSWMVECLG